VCPSVSASSTVCQFGAGSTVPCGYFCACRSPLEAGIYLGASVFVENPKSMSEGPLFLGGKEINKFVFYLKFLFHFAFWGLGGAGCHLG